MRLNSDFIAKHIASLAFAGSLLVHVALLLMCVILGTSSVDKNSLTQKIEEFEHLLATMPAHTLLTTPLEPKLEISVSSVPSAVVQSDGGADSVTGNSSPVVPHQEVCEAVYNALKYWKLEAVPVQKKRIVSALKLHKKVPDKNNKKDTKKVTVPKKAVPIKQPVKQQVVKQSVKQQQAVLKNNKQKPESVKRGESFPLTSASYNSTFGAYVPDLPLKSAPLSDNSSMLEHNKKAINKALLDIMRSSCTGDSNNVNNTENPEALMNIRFTDTRNALVNKNKAGESQLENLSVAEMAALREHYAQLVKAVQDITRAFNEQLELPAHIDNDSVPELEVTIKTDGSCAQALISKSSGLLIKDLAFKRVALSLTYPAILKGRTFTLYFAV